MGINKSEKKRSFFFVEILGFEVIVSLSGSSTRNCDFINHLTGYVTIEFFLNTKHSKSKNVRTQTFFDKLKCIHGYNHTCKCLKRLGFITQKLDLPLKIT